MVRLGGGGGGGTGNLKIEFECGPCKVYGARLGDVGVRR